MTAFPADGLPLLPVYLVDFFGASLMILLSLIAFYYAKKLTDLEPRNVLWTYLFWLCMSLVAFALSRGIGHVLRFVFNLLGFPGFWKFLAPYSGGLNTITFVSVAVLTFYYPNVRKVIDLIQDDAKKLSETNRKLEEAHRALKELNLNLEKIVEERTRELKISEQKFRGLFEGSKDMIFFCDEQGRISDINDSGVALLGFQDQGEIIGKPLVELFSQEENWEQYYSTLCGEGHIKDLEVEFTRADGTKLFLIITASAIKDDQGNIKGCEGIAKDLTQFKRVMEQLIQSEKMASIGQLAAGVAHEINTPLGIILGYTQLLQEDFEDQPEVYETLQIIEKQTKICRRIVADLLRFSRQTIEDQKLPVDVNKCLEDALAIIEHSLNLDRIYVHKEYTEDLPKILGNPEKLRQVFINIVTNAHHAIGQEGIVGIWTRYNRKANEVEIIIGDTGPGIPPEIINKIFDPFFSTKEVGKGTGLGLSLSFGFIRDHGGSIEVQSPPEENFLKRAGMETVFIVHLPALKEENEGAEE